MTEYKSIELTVKVKYNTRVPKDWDDTMIMHHFNESSWCWGTMLNSLNEYADNNCGCICKFCEAVSWKESEEE